ncbi:MAG: endolytic transglycosylase MltG [Candidatus Solibacter sp.]|nr:endolytic transglycosylase MltG [Candidatus Solibacter sp.]
MKRFLAAAGLVGAMVAGMVHIDRYKGFGEPVFVEIPRGTSSLEIGKRLALAGVIRHWSLFALARVLRPPAGPQAGEYRFAEAATPSEVLSRMARGDVHYVELVVPEGSDVFDIGEELERQGLASAEAFIEEAREDEGYLFPSTYKFMRSATPKQIRGTMRAQFDQVWRRIAKGAPSRETVILASLVEKEAVLEGERARIAGVYANRLKIGMKLDADPTVEYAARLDGRWRGTIYKSDLASRNLYNTYMHPGLPPGPIANPGEASLRAALKPEQTKAIYFVAAPDGSGTHVFSETFAAHEKAVAAYRRATR